MLPTPLVTPVPPDIAARLDVDRATVLANMFRVIAIAGLNIMGLWMVDFGNGALHDMVRVLLACGAADYCMILFRGEVWLRANPATRQPSTYLSEMLLLLVGLGLIWAILLITLMSIADPAQHALVYAMIVAGMSTAVLVAPLSISIAFWLPVTAGAYVSMFVSSQPFDPFALVCLASYTVLTGFSAIYLNNKLTERAISAIRVEENSEVIKLLLRDFEESTSDWLWETDASMQLRRISARLAQVAGRAPDQIIGRFPESLLGDIARMEVRGASPVHRLKALIEQRAAFRDVVIPVTIDGEERFWSLTGKPVLDKSGAFAGYHGVGSDITAQRRSQEQIAFLARHDSLTKLPNRVLFNEALHQSCDRCEAQGLALLCLDLDDFKLVNDTMGHATGDGVLVAVGERIRGCLRDGDVAARLGGDEFAVILVQTDPERTVMIAERIIDRVSRPYQFDGRLIQIGISIGISLAPQDGTTPSGLMKNADLALYRAKAEGRGIWRLYDPAMDERLQDRRTLQSDLRQAVLLGEFCIDYQPVVDLKAQRIVGAEALLRWMHPVRGLLSPAQFIPMAEDAGLIGATCLHRGQHVAAAIPRSGSRRRHRPGARRQRRRALAAGARNHRNHHAGDQQPDPGRLVEAARPRRPNRARRFRHRLFLAQLPAALPVRQDQDRPHLHPRPGLREGRFLDHHGHHRPRRQHGHDSDRRRRRDHRTIGTADRLWLRPGPGLPVLRTDLRGGDRQRHRPGQPFARGAAGTADRQIAG
jgi:diguanylate cyclase (GGDEF)-like protein/PAS domain S-box-containing protein